MAGTLVSYLPFTRSVTEDLSGKEWTVNGNPQIVIRPDFPVPVAQFGENDYIKLPDITLGGTAHWLMDFWIFIPTTTDTKDFIYLGEDDWFHSALQITPNYSYVCQNKDANLNGLERVRYAFKYFNKWVNIKLAYTNSGYDNTSKMWAYISDGTGDSLAYYTPNKSNLFSIKQGTLSIGGISAFISQFRFYSRNDTFYISVFLPNPPTTSTNSNIYQATRENFAWNEFQVHDTVNFDYTDNITYTQYNKSQQWIYKNIGTVDDLLVSGTSLTNVNPAQSITSKAFYQTARKKCFDTQLSKEIYMLFDVYFNGSNRWRAYEENNGTTGITAQTSGVLNIFSNGTNVGASIPLTINKLETYLLHMKSDSTNGFIEVYKDGEYKYTYTGNVNNGDDFNNLNLQSDGSGTVFSNVVISNQPVYDSDRLVGNYNTIQRTLSNETWAKEKNLKVYLPCTNNITEDFCGNIWNVTGTTPTIVTTNYLNGKATEFVNGYIYTTPPELKSNDFSIDWWEYIPSSRNSFTSEIISIDGTTGTGTQTLDISYPSSTVPYLYLGKGKSTGWVINNKQIGTKLRDQWVHRAIVRYNDTIYAFENGTLYTSVVIGYDFYIDITGDSLFIGGFKRDSRPFVGMLSEIRVYVGYAVWTENFTPPNQEDYFETYWYFNKPAPILNTNYNMFRSLINASKIWKYINPGYPDLCVSSQYSGITYEPLDQESNVALAGTTNIDLTNMKYITDDEIWIKWTVSYDDSPKYFINIMNEDSEYVAFLQNDTVGHFCSSVDNTDLFGRFDSQHHSFDVNLPSGSYCILHVKSHITNGIIELFVNSDLVSIKVIQGNINAGKKFTKVNLQMNASSDSTEISNIIISTGQLTSSDKIASNLNPVQRTLTNDEEWRFAKYVLQSWMLFENSPTEDLCGNTWTAYNNPSIIDTDVLHGKALQLNSGQYLSMTNTISLGGDKDLTISGWYNMSTSSGTWASMFTFWQTANGGHIIKLSQNNASKRLAWDFSFGTYDLSNANIDNKLHHFAYVYQAETKKISIYIDGKRLIYGSKEISRYDYKLYLGKSNYSADKAYVGTINEFKVYDGYAEFTEEFTPPIPQLVSNKLYYNKSTQTMKFEYFADVRIAYLNVSDFLKDKVLAQYYPFTVDKTDVISGILEADIAGSISNGTLETNDTYGDTRAIVLDNLSQTDFLISINLNMNIARNAYHDATKLSLYFDTHHVEFTRIKKLDDVIISSGTNAYYGNYNDDYSRYLIYKKEEIYNNSITLQNPVDCTILIMCQDIDNNRTISILLKQNNSLHTLCQYKFNNRDILDNTLKMNVSSVRPNYINTLKIDEISIYSNFANVSSELIDNYITYKFNNNEESVYFEFYANLTFDIIKLSIKKIGDISSYTLSLFPFKMANPNFAIYHNDKSYYNKLVLPTDPQASNIRIYHNNTVYALSK